MTVSQSVPAGAESAARGAPGANISYITERVWTGGDLPSDLGVAEMLADLSAIRGAGITDILDNRIEWTDEDFVRAHAPDLGYRWNGADDAGQLMPDSWFDRGVGFALAALEDPDAQVLAHCHMGINRGPSMAFAILLALGLEPGAALTAIRASRPIAAIAYADDALDWWHRSAKTPAAVAQRQVAEVAAWHRSNPLDVGTLIRLMRDNEGKGRPSSVSSGWTG